MCRLNDYLGNQPPKSKASGVAPTLMQRSPSRAIAAFIKSMKYKLKDNSNPRRVIREGTIARTFLNAPPVVQWQGNFYWRSCASTKDCMIYYQGGGEFLGNIEIPQEARA